MAEASIEDWFEINNLFTRYTTSLDRGDVERFVECFNENGRIESPIIGVFEGHSGVRTFAERTARALQHGTQFRHIVSNLTAEVEGDRAKARCYLLDFVTQDGKTELLSPGVYECDLTRRNGKWLFDSRLVLMDRQFAARDKA
jgi:3-phenylpropionate/cinnamic acid dioxygenase small subunit